MMEKDEDLSNFVMLDIVHALSEGSNALKKTVTARLEKGGHETNYLGLSVYERLEVKLDNHELSYSHTADLLRILFREFEYFGALVQNLLGFLSSGDALEINRDSVDVKRLLEEVIALFEGAALEKGLTILLEIKKSPKFNIDRLLMRRAFINLLDNAVKYSYASTPENPRFIRIYCGRHSINEDWLFSFESYGVGITHEEISSGSVFEYGTRGHLSGDRGRRGTGIGLAETKRIIEAHGGKVHIVSVSKGGDAYFTSIKIVMRRI